MMLSTRQILSLALPMAGEQFLIFGIGLFDTAVAGQLGVTQLSTQSVVLRWVQFTSVIFNIVAVGGSILVAQAIANDKKRASDTALAALLFALVAGLATMLFALIASDGLLRLIGVEADVRQLGTSYLRVMALSFAPSFMLYSASGCLRGAGDGRTPLIVIGAANVLHVGLALTLALRLDLDLNGLGWATLISRSFGFGLMLYLLLHGVSGLNLRLASIDWQSAVNIWRVGRAVGGEQLALRLGQIVNLRIIALLGTASLATYAVVLNSLSIILMIGVGFMNATLAIIGQQMGANQHDELYATTGRILRLAWGVMGFMGIMFFLFPQVSTLFSDDPQTLSRAEDGLRIILIAIPFEVVNQILTGTLRGVGNTRYPMLVTTFGHWLIRLPLMFIMIRLWGLGLNSVWLAMIIEMAVRAVINARRVRQDLLLPLPQAQVSLS